MKIAYAACSSDKEQKKMSKDFRKVFSNHFDVKPWSYCIKVVLDGRELISMDDRHRFQADEYPDPNAVFIPVANVLAHAEGMLGLYTKYKIPYNQTEIDAFVNASLPDAQELPDSIKLLLEKISSVIHGEVVKKDSVYYLKKSSGELIEFALEADGIERFGFLWKILNNGLIEPGSILFWDEPETSINPEHSTILVEILLNLSRAGVQIFIATHNNILSSYLSANKEKNDALMFFSLVKDDEGHIKVFSDESYEFLEPNKLSDEPVKLYMRQLERGLGNG
jgi:hypothetical protein